MSKQTTFSKVYTSRQASKKTLTINWWMLKFGISFTKFMGGMCCQESLWPYLQKTRTGLTILSKSIIDAFRLRHSPESNTFPSKKLLTSIVANLRQFKSCCSRLLAQITSVTNKFSTFQTIYVLWVACGRSKATKLCKICKMF